MRNPIRFKYEFYIIGCLLLPGSGGCDKADGECNALAHAITEAREIADEYLPGGSLAEIIGNDVKADGTVTSNNDWSFYYFKQSTSSYDHYAVTVSPDCKTFHWDPAAAITYTGIPSYTSAAEWVSVADQSMADVGKAYNYRNVQVFADDTDYYIGTENLVYVFYYTDLDAEPVTWILLDADDNSVLYVEANP